MKKPNISRLFIKILFAAGLLAATTITSCENADGTIPPADTELGVTTLPAGDITETTARINGCYKSDYSDYIADTGFDYRKSGETSWTRVWLGTAPTLFRYQLEVLEDNSAYEFVALIKRSDDGRVVEGSSIGTFTTDPIYYDSPFMINGIAAGTKAVVTFIDGTTQDITVDRQITAMLPVKMIYSISSSAFFTGDILIGRMSDETIQLSFGEGGVMQLRESGGRIQINTYAELALINANETLLAYSYSQVSDIDLLGSEDITAAGLERQNWVPIGVDYMNCFAGSYDGAGKEISNLYITGRPDYTGLFGSNSGTLSNIHIVSGSVSGTDNVGGVCGLNFRGTITGCRNAAQVSGALHVGGVCGFSNSYCTISDCHNSGQVSGTGNFVGGVCGNNSASVISNCTNSGQVSATGYNNVGGIAGGNTNGSILTSCHNTGSVKGKESVAGVCGYNNNTGKVTGSRNDGAVSGELYVGGVCGFNLTSCITTACYNTGKVTGGVLVGGVCGFNNAGSAIGDCYNTGSISGTTNVGGVSGLNTNSTITTSYWLKYAAGPSNGIGAPPSDTGAAPFSTSSWPTDWTLWTSGTPDPTTGPFWKSHGSWLAGGTPEGVNSTFPKLYWEQ